MLMAMNFTPKFSSSLQNLTYPAYISI